MNDQGNVGNQVGGHGSDHGKVVVFYTAKKQKFELEEGSYTIDQLRTIFKVEAGYVLELFTNGRFQEFGSPLELKDGMHFNSFAPTGQSS